MRDFKGKMIVIVLLVILFFSEFTVSAQASWAYTVWFNLTNQAGEIISKEDVANDKVKLLSMPFGAHSDNQLQYDTITGSFKFSQHTIATGSVLAFVCGVDTTTVKIETQDLYLDKIALTGDTYVIQNGYKEEGFICNEQLSGYNNRLICKNKYPISLYKAEKKKHIELDKLIEVKLE